MRLHVGYNAAIGSLFEDEALIMPDPHIPIRLKQADFAKANNSRNNGSVMWHVIKYGGAYTSLRIRVSGIEGVPPSGGKGDDIEIDYTIIDPVKHIVYLCEFKKGYGAQKKGDAIQLNRAAVAVSYHYQAIHRVKPKFYAFFIAGAAVDADDIELPDKSVDLSPNISFFSNTRNHLDSPGNGNPTPFVVHLMTAEAFAVFAGINVSKIKKIMGLRATEHAKFGDALLLFERFFAANPTVQQQEIKELVNRFPNVNWPNVWKLNTNQARVNRLLELDMIPSLVFKKREYEKTINNNRYNYVLSAGENKSQVLGRWLGIVEKISKLSGVTPEGRAKYARLAKHVRNQVGNSVKAIEPNISTQEQIILRSKYLGPAAYKVKWPMTGLGSQVMRYNLSVTASRRISKLSEELTALIKTPANNKFQKLLNFGEKITTLPVINPTTRKSSTYAKLEKEYNRYVEQYKPRQPVGKRALNVSMFQNVQRKKPQIEKITNETQTRANATALLNRANLNNTENTKFETLYAKFLNTHAGPVGQIMTNLLTQKRNGAMNNNTRTYYQGLMNHVASVS